MSRRVPNRAKSRPLRVLIAAAIAILALAPPAVGLGDDEQDFLVAQPTIADPLFEKSVILMIPAPAISLVAGLIINKPTAIPVKRVFPHSVDLDRSEEHTSELQS